MKNFFGKYSYQMVRMFLNQFATAMFGFSLALATARNVPLRNLLSVAAILFYLFLLYTMTWEIGFRDRVQPKGQKPNPFNGFLISLCANSLNLLLAVFNMLANYIENGAVGWLGGASGGIAYVFEGMYMGILANNVGDVKLQSLWYMYFLIVIPAVLVCGVAYLLGLHDKKFTPLFNHIYPDSDRDRTKREQKKLKKEQIEDEKKENAPTDDGER